MNGDIENNKKEVKVITFPVRGLRVNSPIILDVEILPVESFKYADCVKEMELFVRYLVDNADISLSVRLLKALFSKLPSMCPPNIDKLIEELEEKDKKNRDTGYATG